MAVRHLEGGLRLNQGSGKRAEGLGAAEGGESTPLQGDRISLSNLTPESMEQYYVVKGSIGVSNQGEFLDEFIRAGRGYEL